MKNQKKKVNLFKIEVTKHKIICVLMVILMCISLCACGAKNEDVTSTDSEGVSIEETLVIESRVGDETLQYPAKNEEFEYNVYETYVEISKYISTETIVTVPDTIEELPVKSIGDWSFVRCENITSVKLPNGIVQIGCEAFEDCSSLKEINLPDGVEVIEKGAFHGCLSLVELTIPKSVKKMGEQVVGSSGRVGTYQQTDVVVKVYKASYALQWVMDNYVKNYEVLE